MTLPLKDMSSEERQRHLLYALQFFADNTPGEYRTAENLARALMKPVVPTRGDVEAVEWSLGVLAAQGDLEKRKYTAYRIPPK